MEKRLFDLPPAAGMPSEMGTLLAALDDSSREWRDELGDVPIEALTWQPFSGGHSIGAVLLHIADVENYWMHDFCLGVVTPHEEKAELLGEETMQDDVNWPTPPAKPLEWYMEKLDWARARTMEALTRMGPTDERIEFAEKFEMTRRWVLAHVVEHDSYHGGQAVLLKLMWERMVKA